MRKNSLQNPKNNEKNQPENSQKKRKLATTEDLNNNNNTDSNTSSTNNYTYLINRFYEVTKDLFDFPEVDSEKNEQPDDTSRSSLFFSPWLEGQNYIEITPPTCEFTDSTPECFIWSYKIQSIDDITQKLLFRGTKEDSKLNLTGSSSFLEEVNKIITNDIDKNIKINKYLKLAYKHSIEISAKDNLHYLSIQKSILDELYGEAEPVSYSTDPLAHVSISGSFDRKDCDFCFYEIATFKIEPKVFAYILVGLITNSKFESTYGMRYKRLISIRHNLIRNDNQNLFGRNIHTVKYNDASPEGWPFLQYNTLSKKDEKQFLYIKLNNNILLASNNTNMENSIQTQTTYKFIRKLIINTIYNYLLITNKISENDLYKKYSYDFRAHIIKDAINNLNEGDLKDIKDFISNIINFDLSKFPDYFRDQIKIIRFCLKQKITIKKCSSVLKYKSIIKHLDSQENVGNVAKQLEELTKEQLDIISNWVNEAINNINCRKYSILQNYILLNPAPTSPCPNFQKADNIENIEEELEILEEFELFYREYFNIVEGDEPYSENTSITNNFS